MASPSKFALLGSGIFISSLIIRWILDREIIRLRVLLGRNLRLLSAEEVETARMLLKVGYEHTLKHWPPAGVRDAEKHAFLRAASQSMRKALAFASKARLPVLQACLSPCMQLQ